MLRELHIANLAVIEDAHIEFAAGLNCFTGQTGAGKSLIIGALHLLLGHRPASGAARMVRTGCKEARLSAVFELHDAWTAQQVVEAADTPLEPGDDLLIVRKILSSGRSAVAINGQPSTAGIVKRVGELLVDIHGQRDHQFLLSPSNQLLILDRYGKSMPLRARYEGLYREHRELTQRFEELNGERELRRQRLELYEFQAGEIDDAGVTPGEYRELKQRHARLSNAQKIQREAGAVAAALYDSESSISERLQMVVHTLIGLAELDESLEENAELARSATLTLEEVARDLVRYTDRVEFDAGQLAAAEDRLNTLNRLIAKYADHPDLPASERGASDDPAEAVLSYRRVLGREIDLLRGQDRDAGELVHQLAQVRTELNVAAGELSEKRAAAAEVLAPNVEAELHELGMPDARFEAVIRRVEPDEGSDASILGGPNGQEGVEFLVRLNPGQAASPLRAVASGGELSRVMLAIKAILADDDRVSVLVFDEIDANIGGRLGTVIGSKLRSLADPEPRGRGGSAGKRKRASARLGHQVLCITHLPQIAAFANQHLSIHKAVSGQGTSRRTTTTVSVLDRRSRVAELAEMLAGTEVSATTRKQARELIDLAGSTTP